MSRKRQTRNEASEPIITPERLRHGPVELAPATISDSAGRPSRPYRAVDTLTIMERRGSITAGMRQAGEDFRHRFALAQLDPLRALDLSRLSLGDKPSRRGDHAPGLRAEAARTIAPSATSREDRIALFGTEYGLNLRYFVHSVPL